MMAYRAFECRTQAAAKAAVSGCGRAGRERVWKQNKVATKNG